VPGAFILSDIQHPPGVHIVTCLQSVNVYSPREVSGIEYNFMIPSIKVVIHNRRYILVECVIYFKLHMTSSRQSVPYDRRRVEGVRVILHQSVRSRYLLPSLRTGHVINHTPNRHTDILTGSVSEHARETVIQPGVPDTEISKALRQTPPEVVLAQKSEITVIITLASR
jgi:hypothetical protein